MGQGPRPVRVGGDECRPEGLPAPVLSPGKWDPNGTCLPGSREAHQEDACERPAWGSVTPRQL